MSDSEQKLSRKRPGAGTPKKKVERRPRIDAILRAIKSGAFDEDMGVLQGAMDDRRRVRQEAVLALVHETFGENYSVSAHRSNPVPRSLQQPGVFDGAIKGANSEAIPDGWVDTTAEAVTAQEPTTVTVDSTVEGEDEDGIESRSPIIGGYEPEAPQTP